MSRFSRGTETAEANLLRAYLRMDETSEDYFIRALKQDKSILPYGARLSKRLLKLGHQGAAYTAMLRIQAEDQSKLISVEKDLIRYTSESIQDGVYSNSYEKLRYVY